VRSHLDIATYLDLLFVAPDLDAAVVSICEATLIAGLPVVDLVAVRRPSLPDDTLSWAKLAELTDQLDAAATGRFEQAPRPFEAGQLLTARRVGAPLQVLALLPSQGPRVLLIAAGHPLDRVWRVVVPASAAGPLPPVVQAASELLTHLGA
jgi:hypothetical protein